MQRRVRVHIGPLSSAISMKNVQFPILCIANCPAIALCARTGLRSYVQLRTYRPACTDAQALTHNGCRRIRWLRFDGYSGKFAYRPIGQRGDPLKIIMYHSVSHFHRYSQGKCNDGSVYILGSCRRRFVGYIGEKKISQPLRIAIASGGLQN